ncbi:DUF998 domain-containing protein [Kibdelosporangium phytohabitans]|uniref:DUF998 domain-containing protein n=1 Tax=Kibdelosporangium phytohabitans TaxID=860235 RepID=A0A0N9HSC0_9PSEU|nr:DUF998 domain-containing protein [Kibdelosporangium phytohabitans]ALG06129.1 hypothetical protein AOZ06_03615 [Kibdelosporangium phytohabitans]MBE1465781.1 hypothetical protein [Kibdelosporangium phytohabitans]
MNERMTRLLAGSALLWMVVGISVAVYLEIVYAGTVHQTFSEYVHTGQGARLAGVAMLAVGFSSLAAAGALWSAGGPRSAYWLILVWGVGLAVLAIFPQEPADQALTWHGAIHRHAALAGLITLPLAGLLLSRQWPLLVPFSIVSFAALAVFVLTFVVPGWRGHSGIAERFVLGVDIGIVGVLIRRLIAVPVAVVRTGQPS